MRRAIGAALIVFALGATAISQTHVPKTELNSGGRVGGVYANPPRSEQSKTTHTAVNSVNPPNTVESVPSTDAQAKPQLTSTPKTPAPQWLLSDLKAANEIKFPISAQTYSLTVSGNVNFNPKVWTGAVSTTEKASEFSVYYGRIDMPTLSRRVRDDELPHTPITVVEQHNGETTAVFAYSIDLGNGGFLAFAQGQVITNSFHAGFDTYTVYAVPRIQITNA